MKELHEMVDQADAIIITAGAGMGVDSGLPDFRGTHGLWEEYPELKARDLDFEQMATPKWFTTSPALAWAFYGHRLHKYLKVKPHEGFNMLLDICKEKSDNYFVVTSNVDNHFQKAGFDPMKIHEIHGSISYFQCIYGCNRDIWPAEYAAVKVDEEAFKATKMPTCPDCGKVARPNILMFDDYGWLSDREREQRRRRDEWVRFVRDSEQKVVIIEIGAGKSVPSIRRKSEHLFLSLAPHAEFIRINPRDYDVPAGAISIKAGGLEGIKSLDKEY